MNQADSSIHGRHPGFTIVEVALVIIVIGVLASITIIAWSGWRERTATTEVKNDLTTVASSMESERNWGNGYPVFTPGTAFGDTAQSRDVFTPSTNVTLVYAEGDETTYCVNGTSQTEPSVRLFIRVEGSERVAQEGTCAD